MSPGRAGQRGSALLVVPVCVAVVAALALGIGRIGDAAHRRARADAVADLVALAAVTGGDEAGTEVAQANRATMVTVSAAGSVRTVVVDLDGVRSSASAAPGDP
ncbi:MAG: hypothetical protein ACHQDC_04985 [Acidimicrobiales bacterium]